MLKYRLPVLAAGLLLGSAGHAANITPQLKVNGYATAGVAWLDEDSGGWGKNPAGQPVHYDGAAYMQNSYGRAGITEDVNTKFDSVMGLQFDYQVNEQTNLVTQLVAKGQNHDSFKVQADWAYIRYAFNDNWSARAGRLGFPGFMYSDSMQIGYSHPWARLPAEVYANTPVPSVQGLDVGYRYNIGDWTLGAEAFGGTADTSDGRLGLKNVASLYLSARHDDFTFRAGRMEFVLTNNVSLTPVPNLPATTRDSFTSVGAIYDNNKWLVAAEYVRQRVDSWPADFDAGYVTIGHYFGKWLPYATWAAIDTLKDKDKSQPMLSSTTGLPTAAVLDTRPSSIFEQTSYSVGLRFDPKPGLAIKAQVDHVTGMDKYNGIFRFANVTGAAGNTTTLLPGTAALGGAAELPPLKSTNVYSLTASVAF